MDLNMKVMIVDDFATMRRILRNILKQIGFKNIIEADDGKNALNPFSGAPDWLNLPVLMEDIERIEILRGPGGAVDAAKAMSSGSGRWTFQPEAAGGYEFTATCTSDKGVCGKGKTATASAMATTSASSL